MPRRIWGVIALGLLARILWMHYHSLWLDEGWSWWLSSNSLSFIFRWLHYEFHVPLYYLMLHYWQLIGQSALFLRSLSLIFDFLSLCLIYRLTARHMDEDTAALAALLYALSANVLYVDIQARMYALFILMSLGSIYCTLEYEKGHSPRHLALLCLFLVAGMMSHYYFIFVLCASGLHLLLYSGRRKAAAAVLVFTTAVCALWLPFFLAQVKAHPLYGAASPPHPIPCISLLVSIIDSMFNIFLPLSVKFLPHSTVITPLCFGATVALVLYGTVISIREQGWKGLPMLFIALSAASLLFSAVTRAGGIRYFCFLWPFVAIFFAAGLQRLARSPLRTVKVLSLSITAAVIVTNAAFVLQGTTDRTMWMQDVKGPADYIRARQNEEKDVIVVLANYLLLCTFNYYYADRAPILQWDLGTFHWRIDYGASHRPVRGARQIFLNDDQHAWESMLESLDRDSRIWYIQGEYSELDRRFGLWLSTRTAMEEGVKFQAIDDQVSVKVFALRKKYSR